MFDHLRGKEYLEACNQWVREHAAEIVAAIQNLDANKYYLEIQCDFSGVIRSLDNDDWVAEFDTVKIVEVLGKYQAEPEE